MNTTNTATKTLPPSIVIPEKIKKIGKTIQFFSSDLATKFAYKLFVKPVRFSTPKREVMMQESAQRNRMLVPKLNKEIEVLSYGYSPKKVLLVHGWSGRSTQFFMLADKLLENGYMIISFDAPAHGNSQGETTHLLEFVESIKEINNNYGPFESAVGHSLGGIALYNTASILKLNSFVTIGSADSVSDICYRFTKNLGLKNKIGKKLKEKIDTIFTTDTEIYSSAIQAKQLKMPVLVVHDELDADVDVSCAKTIRQNLQSGNLLITHGLGHTKILRDHVTMQNIVNFIKEQ